MTARRGKKRGGGNPVIEDSAVIKANDDAVYYSGVYWNDYPVVSQHINKVISGNSKTDWFTHFRKSHKNRVFNKALIINCGNGWVERKFYEQGLFKEAVGVDYSEGLLDEARQAAKKMPLRYYQMDINNAVFPEDGFDLIINNASGHHIAYIDKVFQAMSEILSDDGLFVNFDYVGPNRNQYTLFQWLASKRVNRKLPENVRQNMQYPHLPTMLVTDPSEAVHSELVLRSTKRYFKIREHKRMGGPIAYLLLTHNEKMQHANKKDVKKWSEFIMEADSKLVNFWPSTSMFDYWVAVKKAPSFYTKQINGWYAFVERNREKHAQARGGAYYPYRPKIMQRLTIWKENRRLKRIEAGRSEQSIFSRLSQLARAAWDYYRQNGFKHSLKKALVGETQRPELRAFRQSLVGIVVAGVAVITGLVVLRAGHGYKNAAIYGFAVGVVAAILLAVMTASPSKTKQFMYKNKFTLAALAVSIAFFCIGYATLTQGIQPAKDRGLGITFDEVTFIPSGYYYQSNGKYFLSPEHPPLVKDVGAIPLKFMNLEQPEEKTREVLLQDYAQYLWGKELVFETNSTQTEKIIMNARTSVLAVNSILIFVLFLSLARVWSKRTALLAVFLVASSQFTIAHGMLVTMDVMAALLTMLALTWFGIWLRRFKEGQSTKKVTVVASAFLAGALLAKFSAILLVPLIVGISAVYLLLFWKKFKGRRIRFVISIAGAMVLTFVFVSLWYSWHVRNMSTEDVTMQLQISYPIDRYPEYGRNIVEGIAGVTVVGRGFAEYTHGLFMVNNRIYKGAFGVYFNGHDYGNEGAGPAYFPSLYGAKLQITYHVLSLVSVVGALYALYRKGIKQSARTALSHPEVILLASYSAIFAGIAVFSTLQIGLRHIFPAILGFTILTALGIDYVLNEFSARFKYLKPAVVVALIIIAVSTLMSYPYYLSYYNAFAGGTNNGYKLASDSNYDWGQDIEELAKWKEDNGVDKLYIDLFVNPFLPINYYLGPGGEWYKIEKDTPLPSGSYIAVSAQIYQANKYKDLPADKHYSQYEGNQVGRAGKSIFIFRVP